MKRTSMVLSVLLILFIALPLKAQDTTGTPINFTGTVDSINGTTLIVAGLTVDAGAIESGTLSQLVVGMPVTVSGTLNNGTVTAIIIVLPEVSPTSEPVVNVQPVTPEQSNILADANYTVSFDSSSYDGSQTTFNYTVTGQGVATALSHFTLEVPLCTSGLELIAYTPADAVELGIDPTTGVDGIKWNLPLGTNESRSYSVSFLGFVAEGTVTTAVKNGDGFFTVAVGGPSCAQPSVDLEKYVSSDNGATWADADDAPGLEILEGLQVSYRLVITNDGNVPISNLVLTDSLADTSSCNLPAELESGVVFGCVLGPFNPTGGQVVNTATINAVYSGMTITDSDSAHYFTGALPAIDIEKYVSIGNDTGWIDADVAPGADTQAGDQVFFRFVVTNTGNIPLTGVTMTDNQVNTGTCTIPAELEPNGSAECVVGPLLAIANQHTNIATVTATGNGISVEDSDTANYFGRTEPVSAGSFIVTFLGSVYANGQTTFSYGVVGTDTPPDLSHFDLEIPVCSTPLQVAVYSPIDAVSFGIDPTTGINGIKWDLPLLSTSNRTYSITFEGLVALGTITAAVKDGNGAHLVSVPGATCDVAQIIVEKAVSLDGVTWQDADVAPGPDVPLGGQAYFRFIVSNHGNSNLSGITLTDDALDLSSCVIPSTLTPGAFFECVTGPFPIVPGQHVNTATARGTFGGGVGTAIDTDSAHYFGGDRPEMDVEGYVSSNNGAAWIDADAAPGLLVQPGGTVWLRYIMTNTGNVTLDSLSLSGTLGDVSGCVIPTALEPNASFTCLAGTVIVADGQQSDTVTVSGAANGVTVTDSDDTWFFGGSLNDDDTVIIVIEGPVEAINGNTIVIFGFSVILDSNDPRLTVIHIGDIIRIEGSDDGGVLIALVFVFTDVEIFVNNGIVWRDTGTCGNAPPPWAPAWGWRARCEGGNTTIIISGGSINVPVGCKLTGFGNGNIRLKCSRGSRRS